MMARSRVSQILEDWTSVANEARRPAAPPRPVVVRSGLSMASLAGASLLVVAVAIAGVWLGRHESNGLVGGSPSTMPSPISTTAPTPSETPETPASSIASCDPANLSARITLWEGAAGHRIADIELTNTGSEPCDVQAMARPQLVDGHGSVLIDSSSPSTSAVLTVPPSAVLKTLVQAGNYCGPAPTAPTSVAFVFSDGGTIVASPVSPTDATVPPCLAGPGSAGDIEMHPWAP